MSAEAHGDLVEGQQENLAMVMVPGECGLSFFVGSVAKAAPVERKGLPLASPTLESPLLSVLTRERGLNGM